MAAPDFTLNWDEHTLQELLTGPNGAVFQDLARRAIRVVERAKQNASQPPRGGRPNAGSEPGGGPAVRTGRLRASIDFVLASDPEPHYRVGSNVFYAPFVEYGTRRMAARPFLRPALSEASD